MNYASAYSSRDPERWTPLRDFRVLADRLRTRGRTPFGVRMSSAALTRFFESHEMQYRFGLIRPEFQTRRILTEILNRDGKETHSVEVDESIPETLIHVVDTQNDLHLWVI